MKRSRNNAAAFGQNAAPILEGVADALANRNRGRSDTPILDALTGINRGRSDTPVLDALTQNRVGRDTVADFLLNDRLGRNRYKTEEAYAKAYRDVGIANAVASVLGVVAQGYIAQQHAYPHGYGQAHPQAYGPPRAYHAPQPAGHYVRERIVIEEARYEQYQVWIPPRYDSRTGAQLGGGFYETRTRLIPEQYAYREVWVPGH